MQNVSPSSASPSSATTPTITGTVGHSGRIRVRSNGGSSHAGSSNTIGCSNVAASSKGVGFSHAAALRELPAKICSLRLNPNANDRHAQS